MPAALFAGGSVTLADIVVGDVWLCSGQSNMELNVPIGIVVTSPQVPEPLAVRYAWANNPEGCNLYAAGGLPAAPFRTDDW